MNNWTCPHEPYMPCYARKEIVGGWGDAGNYSLCPKVRDAGSHCFSPQHMEMRKDKPDLDPPATSWPDLGTDDEKGTSP